MKTEAEDNEWKAEAPYLASLPRENPFIVPEHYFDALPEHVNNAIYVSELADGVPNSGFTVPEAYFASLQERILLQTSEDTLSKLPDDTGFSTPDEYFKQLQAKIMAKTVEDQNSESDSASDSAMGSKIVRLWRSGILKYASAACFILAAAFGFYLNQQSYSLKPTAVEIANEQMLYDIDEQDIIDHVESNGTDESKTVANSEDLENYILNNYSQSDLSAGL